jgi:PilZ domain
MSTRRALRRKAVLPVNIIRGNGEQKQIAHTLDVTENSARLGGLYIPIEPGEMIEIQRGLRRAKFQIFWVGKPATALSGQAGASRVTPGKSFWGPDFPSDEVDFALDAEQRRSDLSLIRLPGERVMDRRRHPRVDCCGTASVVAPGCNYPVYTEVSDISEDGAYLRTTATFPVNTELHVKLDIAGIHLEIPAVVRTSDALVGMGIAFQKTTPCDRDALCLATRSLRQQGFGLTSELAPDPYIAIA